MAFLKPIATGVETNVALICESGRIYSFLASEGGAPHLVVRIEPGPEDATLISAEPHTPAFIARSEVTAYQVMAQQAQETARNAQVAADALAAEARAQAQAAVEDFRADYPTRLHFVYTLSDRALDPPFHVEAMWHDGQFTYLRSHAQESPALYEAVDGDPTLVAYDLTADGLFIVRRILDSGWLQLGRAPRDVALRTGALVMSVWKKIPLAPGGVMPAGLVTKIGVAAISLLPGRHAADLQFHRRGRPGSRD